MANLFCANCQKAVPLAEENEIRFCPFCGAELELPIEAEQPGGGNAVLLAALKATTLKGIAELRKNLRAKGVMDWILGGTTRWNEGVTVRFIKDTRAASLALAQGLTREPDADIARDAAEFLLFDLRDTVGEDNEDKKGNKNTKNNMDLLLAATERNALDFIPFLREEDKTGMGARYQATRKKSSLLPVQRDILKLLLPKKK
ncbi:MAG: zinc ribbon domain-containing protein [Defluviitaleaceae bacterium]|nr:zinc ribbon domain-containing protein [Defluviitaleaceae bacterium]